MDITSVFGTDVGGSNPSGSTKNMTTINHALWGATWGRLIGLPVEGAVAGSVADLVTVPAFGYYHYFQGIKSFKEMPAWIRGLYTATHNWLVGATLCFVFYVTYPPFVILGFAYLWHSMEDAFVHTDYATPFLFPFWRGKIQKISASEHHWIQWIDLACIMMANIVISLVQGRLA